MAITVPAAGSEIRADTFGAPVANAINGLSWVEFVPVMANLTLGNGSRTHRYARINDLCFVQDFILFGSTSAITGTVALDLPFASDPNLTPWFAGTMQRTSSAGMFPAWWRPSSAQTQQLMVVAAGQTYLTYATAAVPLVPESGTRIYRWGFYRPA